MRSHLGEPLTISALASKFFVSPEHLSRTFRKATGMTVHQYLLRERLREAKRLMVTHKNASVTDIALRVGFVSLSHFSLGQAAGVAAVRAIDRGVPPASVDVEWVQERLIEFGVSLDRPGRSAS